MNKRTNFVSAAILIIAGLAVVGLDWAEATSALKADSYWANLNSLGADGDCNDLSGSWRISTSEGDSTWVLRKNGPMYDARESNGSGRGLATLMEGKVLRLQFDVRTSDGERYGGTYKCKLDDNCQSSLSPCKLTYDFNRTGSYDVTIKRRK